MSVISGVEVVKAVGATGPWGGGSSGQRVETEIAMVPDVSK